MKQALISPNEPVVYTYVTPEQSGCRVAEVSDQSFEVASPLFWVECADDVVADQWYYDNQTGVINPVPPLPSLSVATNQPVSTGAQTL